MTRTRRRTLRINRASKMDGFAIGLPKTFFWTRNCECLPDEWSWNHNTFNVDENKAHTKLMEARARGACAVQSSRISRCAVHGRFVWVLVEQISWVEYKISMFIDHTLAASVSESSGGGQTFASSPFGERARAKWKHDNYCVVRDSWCAFRFDVKYAESLSCFAILCIITDSHSSHRPLCPCEW